jgi:hypothetical protein
MLSDFDFDKLGVFILFPARDGLVRPRLDAAFILIKLRRRGRRKTIDSKKLTINNFR